MFFISATLLARFWRAIPEGKVPFFYLTYSADGGQVNERLCIFCAFAVSFTARGRPARRNKQPKPPQDGKMSKKIPDFTDSQNWTVESTLAERFKKKIEAKIIDSESRLLPHDRELTPVIGLYREAEGCLSKPARASTAASFSTVSISNTAPLSTNTTKSKTALSRYCVCKPTMRARGNRKAKAQTNSFKLYINLAN
jgi:hypothetical protein